MLLGKVNYKLLYSLNPENEIRIINFTWLRCVSPKVKEVIHEKKWKLLEKEKKVARNP